MSGLPPVAAFAPVVDIGLFGGISTGEGRGRWWEAPHAMKRSRRVPSLVVGRLIRSDDWLPTLGSISRGPSYLTGREATAFISLAELEASRGAKSTLSRYLEIMGFTGCAQCVYYSVFKSKRIASHVGAWRISTRFSAPPAPPMPYWCHPLLPTATGHGALHQDEEQQSQSPDTAKR